MKRRDKSFREREQLLPLPSPMLKKVTELSQKKERKKERKREREKETRR